MRSRRLRDLADRTSANGSNAGNRQQIGHERTRRLRIGTGQCGQHTLVFGFCSRGTDGEPIEILHERGFVVEILDQTTLPGRCKIKRGNQRGKQPDIAHANIGCGKSIMGGCLEPQREHLGVRCWCIEASERLNTGL